MKLNLILRICLVAALVIFSLYSILKIPKLTYGFAAYYTSARMVLEGEQLAKQYDFDYFNSKIKEYGFNNIQDMPNNLPSNAFVMLPIAWMEPGAAKIVWGILSILFFGASVLLLLRSFDIKPSSVQGLIFMIFPLLFYPIYHNIALGQIYIALLFLFSLSVYFIKQNRYGASSIFPALTVVFKGYGFLLPVWFLVRKKSKAFFICAGAVVLMILISVPVLGFESWRVFAGVIKPYLLQNDASSMTVYQTVSGFLKHMFVLDAKWNPFPITDLPHDTVFIFSALINLCIIYFFFKCAYKANDDTDSVLISYALILGVSVITAPLAEDYHYVLFLPLILGLGKNLFDVSINKLTIPKIIFISAIVLLALPLDLRFFYLEKPPFVLLAYFRLYAGIALLILGALQLGKKHVAAELQTQ